jgi:hypothetical protein
MSSGMVRIFSAIVCHATGTEAISASGQFSIRMIVHFRRAGEAPVLAAIGFSRLELPQEAPDFFTDLRVEPRHDAMHFEQGFSDRVRRAP